VFDIFYELFVDPYLTKTANARNIKVFDTLDKATITCQLSFQPYNYNIMWKFYLTQTSDLYPTSCINI